MPEEPKGLLGHPGPASKRRAIWSFTLRKIRASFSVILIATFSGLIFYLAIFTFILPKSSPRTTVINKQQHTDFGHEDSYGDSQTWPIAPEGPETEDIDRGWDGVSSEHHATASLGGFTEPMPPSPATMPTLVSEDGLLELSVDELKAMVGRTKGYFVRDWSLGLGWNNVRYIIEAALLQAEILGRTLVIPSFVYSRACEYRYDVCAKYARMVNRNDALDTNQWRHLPLERQLGWVLPIEVMIDIPLLRQKHNVISMTEYLHLQGLNITEILPNGAWNRDYYHSGADKPTLFIIPNNIYDPSDVIRVDVMPPPPPFISSEDPNAIAEHFKNMDWTPDTELGRACNVHLLEATFQKGRNILDWSEAVEELRWTLAEYTNTTVEDALKAAGWVTLHTWEGALGMEYVKSVVAPIKQVAPYANLRGLMDDFSYVTQTVLLLQGETHLGRKPGGLRFTSLAARDSFAKVVLQDIQPPPQVNSLAFKIIERMDRLNNNRLWLAGHMRRGDFVDIGWAMEGTIRAHFDRIKNRLNLGRRILERIHDTTPQTYDIPDIVPKNVTDRKTPKDGDYIYLATDERSSEAMQIFKQSGIKLFNDLVTVNDRREFGWTLLFTDVVALVEQRVIGSGAGYFYAHGMSSVAGGILNIRATSGWDFRTALLD